MNSHILTPNQILNLNPFGYLLEQYYTNVVNRNLIRQIINGGNNNNFANVLNDMNLNNINIVLNTMTQVVDNLHTTLNNATIVNNMNNDQRQELNLINNLRDM
tara:strand:+ start:577 stop:885 length:309 start_codon:yes stop_codon:yes gene_type:complete